ncbi:MAG: helix-turn-helix domain-containing protein [Mesorhizobium sp.]|uniref:helix-turn-helix domain-containing protein n=1 Tax=Mesorhizobium sp. TaxID=1871066 RepID=UPI0012020968|nr:helix-turn-helix domain-containing protein [Mesorhizobium sp.]TIR15283.1 MAG: helix-turn-helix domain-containing protein [Mesorhizobium sp.]
MNDSHEAKSHFRAEFLRPKQAAKILGIGLTSLYQLMGDGTLRSTRVLGARLIPRDDIEAFVAKLKSEAA